MHLGIKHIIPTLNRTSNELTLTCDVYGYASDVWWTKDGIYLNGTNIYFKDNKKTKLVIVDPQRRDNGIYDCYARNSLSSVNQWYRLDLMCK